MDKNWDLFDKLNDELGGDELALSICKALTSDNMNDVLYYIARCWDIKTENDEESEDE
jgi:hypothetical protein